MRRRCIAVLGGSFDPVHNGHVALGTYFSRLLTVDELRIIPAGNPWQKEGLHVLPDARLAMVNAAFADYPFPVKIDSQELLRAGATYTVDTLQALRQELGVAASLSLLIGADQLLRLQTWHGWREIFDYAHLCVASRPGFAINAGQLSIEVEEFFLERLGTVSQLRQQPHGRSFLANDLSIEVSATEIRMLLLSGQRPSKLVPPRVLDYIEQHNLYKRR